MSADPSVTAPAPRRAVASTASTSSSSAPSTSRSSSATTTRPGCGPSSRSTRPPSGPASAAPASTPMRRPRTRSATSSTSRAGMSYKAALAGPRPRRRQGRDHRRPDEGQDRGAAAGLRPLRAGDRRPLLHRLRRGHLLRGHGRRGARVLLRHGPYRRPRRRRRLVGAHGVRRLPGHARQRRGALGLRRPCPVAPSASPGSARSATTWSSTSSTTARRWS